MAGSIAAAALYLNDSTLRSIIEQYLYVVAAKRLHNI